MDKAPDLARVASLVGDPARANMLVALMDGRALTAGELAHAGGITAQTASGHLARLAEGGLLALEKQGRHRYLRLASPLVAQMLEGILVVARDGPASRPAPWRGGDALRNARSCYDHMAGRIAVGIADGLVARALIVLDADGGRMTAPGREVFAKAGIPVPADGRRVFCRPCLDWSERRPHLAGALGAALLAHAVTRGWVRRVRDSRALAVTPDGARALGEMFGVTAESCPSA